MQLVERIDAYVLGQICTPAAHWVQRKTGVISYRIACEVFLLGTLAATAAPVLAFIVGGVSTLAAILTVPCLFIALLYLVFYLLMAQHLSTSSPWKNEPLLVKILTHSGSSYQVAQFVGFVFFTYLLVSIGWQAMEVPMSKDPAPREYLARSLSFLITLWLVNAGMPIGAYFARVRPIPPGDLETKASHEAFQGA